MPKSIILSIEDQLKSSERALHRRYPCRVIKLRKENVKEFLSPLKISDYNNLHYGSGKEGTIYKIIPNYIYLLRDEKNTKTPKIFMRCLTPGKELSALYLESLVSWFYKYDDDGNPIYENGQQKRVSGVGNWLWEELQKFTTLWDVYNFLQNPDGSFKELKCVRVITERCPRITYDIVGTPQIDMPYRHLDLFEIYKENENYDLYLDGIFYKIDLDTMSAIVVNEEETLYGGHPYEGDITIPPSIKYRNRVLPVVSIPSFKGNNKLKSINIGAAIEEIPYDCFYGCSNLEVVTLGSSIKKIEIESFGKCNSLKEIVNLGQVSKIEEGAFTGCVSLKEVHLNKIISIGDRAFEGCSQLSDVTFGNELKTIGVYSFLECRKITKISLPKSCILLDEGAFSDCNSLEECDMRRTSIEEIPICLFAKCESLRSLSLPAGIKQINPCAFADCTSLHEIKFNNGIKQIGSYLTPFYQICDFHCFEEGVFNNCKSLEKIFIPKTISVIGLGCFTNCANLKEIVFEKGIERISFVDNAFEDCKGINSISLPGSVKELDKFLELKDWKDDDYKDKVLPFKGCLNLRKFRFEDSKEALILHNKYILTGVPIEDLYIGRDLEWLEELEYDYLHTLTLSNCIKKAIPKCFERCRNIRTIYSKITRPSSVNVKFSKEVYMNATLFVPKGTIKAYMNAPEWKKFFDIKEF